MKKYLFFILLVFVLLASSCSDIVDGKEAKMYVISIGLDYKNTDHASSLSGTIDDALEVGAAFSQILMYKKTAIDVTFMLQEGENPNMSHSYYPTKANIFNRINEISQKMNKEDMLVLYYSGHGALYENEDGGFLVGAASASHPKYDPIDMKELVDLLDSIPQRTVLIIDACFSGVMANRESINNKLFANFLDKLDYHNVCVLASSTALQESLVSSVKTLEGDFQRHGLFTIKLLDKLQWQHTVNRFVTLPVMDQQNRKINGFFQAPINKLSVDELYRKIISSWDDSYNQTPMLFNSILNTLIVP